MRAAPKAFGVGSGFESRPTQTLSRSDLPVGELGFDSGPGTLLHVVLDV